jgi:hypothetical protein
MYNYIDNAGEIKHTLSDTGSAETGFLKKWNGRHWNSFTLPVPSILGLTHPLTVFTTSFLCCKARPVHKADILIAVNEPIA